APHRAQSDLQSRGDVVITDEMVDLHDRIMALGDEQWRERYQLQHQLQVLLHSRPQHPPTDSLAPDTLDAEPLAGMNALAASDWRLVRAQRRALDQALLARRSE